MTINHINSFFFSPTGTTRKVIQQIAQSVPFTYHETDLTITAMEKKLTVAQDSLAIIGVPVYAGRVAPVAAKRLKNLEGSGNPAILIVLYGNREFEDSLLELYNLISEKNFKVIAAAAFIGEHSFSTEALPIGHGRPDQEDLQAAQKFGKAVLDKIQQAETGKESTIIIPGNMPYRDGIKKLPFFPQRDSTLCTGCGLCATVCPTQAATAENDKVEIDGDKCIACFACIKNCPEKALSVEAPPFLEKQLMLSKNCAKRKQPDFFFSEEV